MKIIALIWLSMFCTGISFAEGDNEWQGFDFGDVGITATEFDKVKAAGMTRAELEKLLEYGIMPTEYFEEPWKKLGVSKSSWIESKKQGLEDGDIDRTLYTSDRFNYTPIVSFFLPGYYHYKTEKYKMGGLLTGIFLIAGTLTFVDLDKTGTGSESKSKESIKLHWPAIAFVTMLWSGFDAYRGTRFTHNREAERFSLDFVPSTTPKVSLSVRF